MAPKRFRVSNFVLFLCRVRNRLQLNSMRILNGKLIQLSTNMAIFSATSRAIIWASKNLSSCTGHSISVQYYFPIVSYVTDQMHFSLPERYFLRLLNFFCLFGDSFFAIRNRFRKSTHCVQNEGFSPRERIVFIDYNIYGIAITINDCCNCIVSVCFKDSNPYHAIPLLIPLASSLRPPARSGPRSGSREPLPA